jgi:hypothetical protein
MLVTGRPAYLPHRLTGNHHGDFLLNVLPKIPEDVSLAATARKGYIHVGAPTHFSRAALDSLKNTYHDGWIGRGGPTAWPPRSPDLNPVGTAKNPCACSSC